MKHKNSDILYTVNPHLLCKRLCVCSYSLCPCLFDTMSMSDLTYMRWTCSPVLPVFVWKCLRGAFWQQLAAAKCYSPPLLRRSHAENETEEIPSFRRISLLILDTDRLRVYAHWKRCVFTGALFDSNFKCTFKKKKKSTFFSIRNAWRLCSVPLNWVIVK